MKKFTAVRPVFIILTVILAVSVLLTGCGRPDPVTRESYYFDTVCKITVYDMEDMSADNAAAAIEDGMALCRKYEGLLSRTKKGSDIYKVNHAGGEWVRVDGDTAELLEKGIYYGELSDGKFDITIGKAEDLYDFHSDTHRVPSAGELKDAAASVDYRNIEIKGRDVRLKDKNSEIDLGGIGKGYIADRVAALLKSEGVTSAIVSLGGNIVTVGDKDGEPFTVGIEKPFSDQSEIIGTVLMKDETIVTSGTYERYFRKNGKFYHHILDPGTGLPADTDILGVTIISGAGNSADCDSLATYCLILGKEKALKLIGGMDGYECLIIDTGGNIETTPGMEFTESK